MFEWISSRDIICKILLFLLGLSSVNNIVYVFVVGTTPIYLNVVIAIVFDIYIVFFWCKGILPRIDYYMPTSFKLFLWGIILSIVPAFIFSSEYISRWLTGVIAVILACSVLVAVYFAQIDISDLIFGMEVGIYVNFIFVLYELYAYNHGIIFRMKNIFPAVNITAANLYNSFRGMGLFKEPGHLARYIAMFSIIVFAWYVKTNMKTRGYSVLIISTILVSFSRSSTAVYFVIALLLTLLLINKNRKGGIFIGLFIVLLFMIVVFVGGRNSVSIRKITDAMMDGILDLSESISSETSARIQGMNSTLLIIKDYPITGVGWNELTSHFIKRGYYSNTVKGAYSMALQYYAQLGVFSLPYFYYMIKHAVLALKNKNSYTSIVGIALMVCFCLTCTTDLNFDMTVAMLFGLSMFTCEGDDYYGYNENSI